MLCMANEVVDLLAKQWIQRDVPYAGPSLFFFNIMLVFFRLSLLVLVSPQPLFMFQLVGVFVMYLFLLF